MARPKVEINPECGKRLKILLEETGEKQVVLSKKIPLSQQTISRIIRGKANLTPENAARIAQLYPQYSKYWLLGEFPIDIKSIDDLWHASIDMLRSQDERRQNKNLAIKTILEYCGFSFETTNGFNRTVKQKKTQKEVSLSYPEVLDYCDELTAIFKGFAEYHLIKQK